MCIGAMEFLPTKFSSGIISKGSIAIESRKVSFNEHVYDFLVNYKSFGKSDISNIHKHSMTRNDIE